MAYRELELTLLSARDLKNVNLITRMDVYAVVTISGDPLTRQCTAPDPSGGRNPCWNTTLRFSVPPTAAAAAGGCLHVLLRAERVLGDRDVGEVIIPLADLLAGAPTSGPQQPQLASYQVRKVHRWEPRGMLNVSYRLGPVVAPVAEPQEKPTVVMAYPVGVPSSQPPRPPADAYPPPPRPPADAYPPPPPPRPAAVHAAKHEEAPAPAPGQPPRNGKSNRLGLEGPTQVCVGPHTQIILGAHTGPPPTGTTTMSPARSNNSPRKLDGARPKQDPHHDDTAAYAPTQPIISPRMEDRSRPRVFSQHHTQVGSFREAEVTSERVAVPPSKEPLTSPNPPSRHPPASTFPSRSSSSSSSSPYASGYPFAVSPCSSAHSSAPSSYSLTHRSTPSPHSTPVQQVARDEFGARATRHTNSYSASNPRATVSS
ncbi:mucin-1-like [Panicum miliaceum]|uniref:Mucin-1-like n=1 Tax=Panicum miliaceum TaxID=4540 RepID=A0A3L6PUV0_PANMI|nr:mucin-1-like [Panicum miliaceum]